MCQTKCRSKVSALSLHKGKSPRAGNNWQRIADNDDPRRLLDKLLSVFKRAAYHSSTCPTRSQPSTVAAAVGSANNRACTTGKLSSITRAGTSGQLAAFFHLAPLSKRTRCQLPLLRS
ncbi:hypothetical protein D3C81_1515890 [compost metagenome]